MKRQLFGKNHELESYLAALGGALMPCENAILSDPDRTKSPFPTVIKIGSPRVGGTLLTQWAASGTAFFIPTNFLSRFYMTPVIGTLINQMLTDPNLDYRDEFSDIQRDRHFSSHIGKTSGLLAPHEFWFFWRHYLHLPEVPSSEEDFVKHSNLESFGKSLKGIQAITKKSLFLKGHLINFYLESFLSKVPDVFFFYLKRDIRDTSRSLYNARVKWTGSAREWFSHKPRQFNVLKELDPVRQVVGQVYFIEKEIQSKLNLLGDRCFSVSYEEMCRRPAETYQLLVARVNDVSSSALDPAYTGPRNFTPALHPPTELDERINAAVDEFVARYGPLY